MLHHDYDLTQLRGAEYNPRKITEDDLAQLRESLRALGIVKPIIVRGTTIVAGHQRTRSALAAGITRGPVYLLDADATTYDEVRFNQLHNGTDLDDGAGPVRITRDLSGVHGFIQLQPEEIMGDRRAAGANVRREIQRLVSAYGPWGGIVALDTGEVIHCRHYALAVSSMGEPVTCYVLPASMRELAERFLGRGYGVFSYEHLPKRTFIQTFAQMFRLRGGARDNRSPTYEQLVIPWLSANPGARVVDFGGGQGDYVASLRKAGANIIGCELFPRAKGVQALDVGAARRMIERLAKSLAEHGRFDAVVCDYVLNSVDSPEAERSVLAVLDLLCKPGGVVFYSGRQRERIDWQDTMTKATGGNRYVEFLDRDGFTALYRAGEWFYQRFHSEAESREIATARGWAVVKRLESATAWNVHAHKGEADVLTWADYEAAIRYEFNLPVNAEGRRMGMHDTMLEAARCALSR